MKESEPIRETVQVGMNLLSMLTAGPRDGEPLLLLHGIPTGSEMWRHLLTRFAERGYRCHAPDLPGYGGTRVDKSADYSIYGAAQLIADWLREASLQNVWLVGHDWGGAVAQALAVRLATPIGRVTLSNCPVENSWPVRAIIILRWIARARIFSALAAARLIPNPYAQWELNRAFVRPELVSAADRRRIFWDGKVTASAGRREFGRHLAALDNAQTLAIAPELSKIEHPILLVWGDTDRFQPWEQVGTRLAELLPDPQVRMINDAGHFHLLERPETFVEVLLNWRSQAGGT